MISEITTWTQPATCTLRNSFRATIFKISLNISFVLHGTRQKQKRFCKLLCLFKKKGKRSVSQIITNLSYIHITLKCLVLTNITARLSTNSVEKGQTVQGRRKTKLFSFPRTLVKVNVSEIHSSWGGELHSWGFLQSQLPCGSLIMSAPTVNPFID